MSTLHFQHCSFPLVLIVSYGDTLTEMDTNALQLPAVAQIVTQQH